MQMSQTWQETSEIVIGLLQDNRTSPVLYRAELFFSPYDNIFKDIKKGLTPEEIVMRHGISLLQTAHTASMSLNGLGENTNWVKLLEEGKALYDAGKDFEKKARKLLRGEAINWSEVTEQARKAQIGIAGDFIPLSEVESGEVPFIASGWPNIDRHLGGIPEVGMILIGGDPGIGKTTAMGNFVSCFAKQYPEKKIAVFSLEMVLCELAMRFREIDKLDKSIEERIFLSETPATADQIINKAATVEDLGLICVDFADLVVEENSEAAYAKMYRTFMFGAKQLHVPILVLVQLVKAKSGMPKPIHLRYTKLAEAFAWQILMLYDPSKDWDSEENQKVLPIRKNTAYILCWKVRGGFRQHIDEAPGAIQLPFSGRYGWSLDKSNWISLKKVA